MNIFYCNYKLTWIATVTRILQHPKCMLTNRKHNTLLLLLLILLVHSSQLAWTIYRQHTLHHQDFRKQYDPEFYCTSSHQFPYSSTLLSFLIVFFHAGLRNKNKNIYYM